MIVHESLHESKEPAKPTTDKRKRRKGPKTASPHCATHGKKRSETHHILNVLRSHGTENTYLRQIQRHLCSCKLGSPQALTPSDHEKANGLAKDMAPSGAILNILTKKEWKIALLHAKQAMEHASPKPTAKCYILALEATSQEAGHMIGKGGRHLKVIEAKHGMRIQLLSSTDAKHSRSSISPIAAVRCLEKRKAANMVEYKARCVAALSDLRSAQMEARKQIIRTQEKTKRIFKRMTERYQAPPTAGSTSLNSKALNRTLHIRHQRSNCAASSSRRVKTSTFKCYHCGELSERTKAKQPRGKGAKKKKKPVQVPAHEKVSTTCCYHVGYLTTNKKCGSQEWTCCHQGSQAAGCQQGDHAWRIHSQKTGKGCGATQFLDMYLLRSRS